MRQRIYQSQINPRGGAIRAPMQDPNAAAAAAGGLGEGVARAADSMRLALEQRAEMDEGLWAAREAAKFRERWATRQIEMEEQAPDGAAGHYQQVIGAFGAERDELLSQAPSASARMRLETSISSLGATLGGRAMRYESAARVDHRTAQLAEIQRADANAIMSAPEMADDALGAAYSAIEASGLPAAAQREMRASVAAAYRSAEISGVIEQDPARAVLELQSGRYDSELSPQDKGRHLTGARRALYEQMELEIRGAGPAAFGMVTGQRGSSMATLTPREARAVSQERIGHENPGAAMHYFAAQGVDPHIAAAFVGNFMVESHEQMDTQALGDNGASFGVAQWQGPRRRALEAFAAERGEDVGELETQLAFVMHELRGSEAGAWRKIQEAETVEEATQLIVRHYERAGVPHTDRRIEHAQAVAQAFDVAPTGDAPTLEDPRLALLEPDQAARLRAARDRAQEAAFNEALPRYQGMIAMAQDGRAVEMPTREELTAQWGAERGEAIADELDHAASFGEFIADMREMTPAEINDRLGDYANAIATGDAEGYVDARSRYETAREAAGRHFQSMSEDPVGYLTGGDAVAEDILQAMREADGPEAQAASMRNFVEYAQQRQAALGVPEDEMRVLPNSMAQNIGANLLAANRGEMGAQLLMYRSAFGSTPRGDRHWRHFVGDIAGAGGLGTDFAVLARYAGQPVAFNTLLQGYGVTSEEAKEGLSSDALSELREGLVAGYEEFAQVLLAGTNDPTHANHLYDLMTRSAMLEARRSGSAGDAVEKIYEAAIGGQYEIVLGDRVTAYAPRSAGVSEDEVIAAAEEMLQPERLQEFEPLDPNGDPIEVGTFLAAMGTEARFVTNDAEDGVIALVEIGGVEFAPIDARTGEPYGFRFEDVGGLNRREIGEREQERRARRERERPEQRGYGEIILDPLSDAAEAVGEFSYDVYDAIIPDDRRGRQSPRGRRRQR